MKQKLLDELMKVSEEEQKYLDGQGNIERQLYVNEKLEEIDRERLLRRGQLITVRPHSRFVDFPEHRHNYVEIMYVVQGSITHYIEGKELVLHKGDVLMLNQQVVHSIKRADYQDIGINFIALPEFFEIPLSMLGEENVLARFVTGVFRQKDPVSHYLLFRLQENEQVENLMENMVESMLHGYADEDIINQYSMGIVFLYLLKHLENLSHNSSMDYKETVVQAVLGYINSDCKNASLTRIAEETHQSMTTLSKLIKEKTGYNFQELLQRKRFQMAEHLLMDTDLTIEESNDRALQIETCEENQIYYAVAAGNIDDDQFEQYKSNECFLGQVGPSMQTEYEAGVDMGKFFADKGIKTAVIYGAFIPNPMHVYRVAGVLSGLGLAYDGSTEEDEVVGKLFANQGVDASKISGDIKIVSYLQGYGDTTTDELNAAIQAAPDAFISVGMATTFFTQQLNAAGIEFSDIDSFTKSNGEAISEGKLVYLAGKYSSSVGPAFALVMNAVNGNVIRDAEGNAVSISQNYQVATDEATFDEFFKTDNGDNPIYNKETLDTIIGDSVTCDDITKLVESK